MKAAKPATTDDSARSRSLLVRGRPIANGRMPLVCAPLVAHTAEAILAELGTVMQTSPDVIEWRADYFIEVADSQRVVALARRIRQEAGAIPLIFTRRSTHEGGEATALSDKQAVRLYEAVCAGNCAEFVDYELGNGVANVARVRAAARAHGVALIASYHNFDATPACGVLAAKFAQAAGEGADVAKVAVMPNDARDVLTLLDATWQAHRTLDIPLISMAMGPLGALSRIAGFMFGSALTFGVGAGSSAPGQLAIDELRTAVAILQRAAGASP
jgi:3-dehydroquinate dehydratase I